MVKLKFACINITHHHQTERETILKETSVSASAIAVGPGLLHDNLHFARQFCCFTWQFSNSSDNLTLKKPETGKIKLKTLQILRPVKYF